ncbi:MAG TPA: hypothetical protein VFC44_01830 [Candidatus Saccharimonadales bacterium]|nr:hypothetical protein [Candidatus Saccharimonadales bacterium]
MNARRRPLVFAAAALVAAWVLAMGGYAVSEHFKMTAEKLRAYLTQTDLARLSGAARARALKDLEDSINALSPEERRLARLGKLWDRWFNEMSPDEQGQFLDATLPSGFKQMLDSFAALRPDKRQRSIDNAIKNLREARESSPEEYEKANAGRTNGPVLSEDLQKKVALIGLKSVYTSGSAQSKAELAPLMEEIQKNMESGRMFR